MIILDSCGEPVVDCEEMQDALRPFREIQVRNERSGPCDDDCEVTAIAIGEAERFERGYLKDSEEAIFRNFLQTGRLPNGMYPEDLFDGTPGLSCAGLLANRKPD